MQITEVLAEFRNQVKDQELPYLWSTTEALGYLIDAQDLFCRLTGGISDLTTPEITTLTLTANNPWSAFSRYITRIRSGTLINTSPSKPSPIKFVQEGDLSLLRSQDYGLAAGAILDDLDTGNVTAGILGIEEYNIRWWKVPDADNTARIHVYRLPYPRIVDENSELEIAEQFHRGLILRMKELAYDKQDAETYDRTARDKYQTEFVAFCAAAKLERQRIVYRPRVVTYGGL